MPRRGEAGELLPVPLEHIICGKPAIDFHGQPRRPYIAGTMNGEFVTQTRIPLSKLHGRLQQSLRLHRCGDLRGLPVQPLNPLQQFTLVPRKQQPLDPLHADLAEVIEDAAVAEIDQERCIAIAKQVGIAGV
jgi:hypothetical protein